jgi:hypothetical protein
MSHQNRSMPLWFIDQIGKVYIEGSGYFVCVKVISRITIKLFMEKHSLLNEQLSMAWLTFLNHHNFTLMNKERKTMQLVVDENLNSFVTIAELAACCLQWEDPRV